MTPHGLPCSRRCDIQTTETVKRYATQEPERRHDSPSSGIVAKSSTCTRYHKHRPHHNFSQAKSSPVTDSGGCSSLFFQLVWDVPWRGIV